MYFYLNRIIQQQKSTAASLVEPQQRHKYINGSWVDGAECSVLGRQMLGR